MAKQKKPSIPPEIKSYIDEVAKKTAAAVSGAYKPLQQPQNAKAAFKNTEARLYALPVLKVKIKDDKEKIEELRTYGTPARSKSITRFSKSSTRMDPEEALEAITPPFKSGTARVSYTDEGFTAYFGGGE